MRPSPVGMQHPAPIIKLHKAEVQRLLDLNGNIHGTPNNVNCLKINSEKSPRRRFKNWIESIIVVHHSHTPFQLPNMSITTSTSPDRLIIILGSGPGIGVGVASFFASQTFNRVALLSRNATRLQQDAKSVVEAAKQARGVDVTVKTYPVDLADVTKLETVLQSVVQELGKPEVVVFNAARVAGGKFFQVKEEDVTGDFNVREITQSLKTANLTPSQLSTLALYTTARVLMPHIQELAQDPARKPAFLVTSGGLYKDPWHTYFSLSLSKASQHNLTISLSQAFSRRGVHVAAVVVHGLVKPESEFFSPKKIASVFWRLYQQGPKGDVEVWVTDGKDGKMPSSL